MQNLKYYIYHSKDKIDMLYSQIPVSIRKKLDSKIKLNLQLAEISFSSKQFSDTLYTKLAVILDYLEDNKLVGSISKPLEYFYGNLFMGWAQIYPGVLFLGGTFNDISVGLGGSMNNLLGYKWDATDVPVGISHTPWLVSLLYREVQMLFPFEPAYVQYGHFDVEATRKQEYEKRVSSATSHWTYDITNNPAKFQISKFEFVAKVLRNTESVHSHYRKVLLGTPIYVAKSE